MGKIVMSEWMSLDGVVQAPAYADEDPSGGFAHGGWHARFFDPAAQQWVVDLLGAADGFLLGRGTYEMFAAHWPQASQAEQPLAEPLNSKPKHVVTGTLADPLEWKNSTVIGTDIATAVPALPGNLLVIGSPRLARSLIAADLVDELRLMVDPLLLGGGKGLFPTDGGQRPWTLAASRNTSTGALLLAYRRAQDGSAPA